MSNPNTNTARERMRSLFHEHPEDVLAQGLKAMTIACDSLTKQNASHEQNIRDLEQQVSILKDKILADRIEN